MVPVLIIDFSDTERTIIYSLIVLVELVCWWIMTGYPRKFNIPVSIPHIADRLGTWVMIIIGESIIQLLINPLPLDSLLDRYIFSFFGKLSWKNLGAYLIWLVGLFYVFCLALEYFDIKPTNEHLHTDFELHALKRKWSGRLFSQGHAFLGYALLGVGVGIKALSIEVAKEKPKEKYAVLLSASAGATLVFLVALRSLHKIPDNVNPATYVLSSGLRYEYCVRTVVILIIFRTRLLFAAMHSCVWLVFGAEPVPNIIAHAVIAGVLTVYDIVASRHLIVTRSSTAIEGRPVMTITEPYLSDDILRMIDRSRLDFSV